MLTQTRLKELLRYDPQTGWFIRLVTTSPRALSGNRAGTTTPRPYRRIWIDGQLYLEHRLAVFYMTGKWPTEEVDHKNTDKSDNRWDNLRPATTSDNGCNRVAPTHNKSGHKGVHFAERDQKWRAQISRRGVRTCLGSFNSREAAAAAYAEAALDKHGIFARLR